MTAQPIKRNHTYHKTNKTNHNHSAMGSLINEKFVSETSKNSYSLNDGDIVSIFGDGPRKRASFAQDLVKGLGKSHIANIDLSKINDPDLNVSLELQKRQLKATVCPEQQKMAERLKNVLDAKSWYDKPVEVLNPEEKAKMLLIFELSRQPEAVIINRPTAIRQFNRKLRALRQVYRRTFIMTDHIWNFPLSLASDRVFEVRKKAVEETFLEI
jgi:hypothetical protein